MKAAAAAVEQVLNFLAGQWLGSSPSEWQDVIYLGTHAVLPGTHFYHCGFGGDFPDSRPHRYSGGSADDGVGAGIGWCRPSPGTRK